MPDLFSLDTKRPEPKDAKTKGSYAFVSLGCAKNLVDSERMLGLLQLDGYELVADPDGADFVIVMVLTDPGQKLHQRASMFVVPMDADGLTLVRNIPVMGDVGREWASHGELRFDGCRVPEQSLLGERGGGFYVAQARLGPGRIHHCMRWIGVCERALRMMCERAATREVAPDDPLGNRQTIQNWIAESRAEIDAARLLVLRAAWKIQTIGAGSSRADISAIKFFVM